MKIIKTLNKAKVATLALLSIVAISSSAYIYALRTTSGEQVSALTLAAIQLGEENDELKRRMAENLMELEALKGEDQYQINLELKKRVAAIETTYKGAVDVYEELLRLKEVSNSTTAFERDYTSAVALLAGQDYEAAEKKLAELSGKIAAERQRISASVTIPANVPVNNDPPSSGYSRQSVDTEIGQYMLSLVSAELGSTRVIVDTASESDCTDNCPTLPLAEYVARNGAYAGINGSYFCPAEYPSCAGKTNSFDTLLMNKNKTYFNSDNNVYSNVPAVIFGGGYIRFVRASSEWGRDTGIDSMIANHPLLIQGGNVIFGGDGDPKKGSKAGRSFVANRGNTVYIGVVHNATVAEAAIALKAMGMENALNLDSGGSTALWSGGYKVGPGRNLPNVILFVRK